VKSSFLLFFIFFPILMQAQLTGYWQSDAGGCYHIVQNGNEIWWASEAGSNQMPYNVFHGAVSGNIITGIWNDLPANQNQARDESISLRIENSTRLVKISSSAPYRGDVWTKQSGPCCVSQLEGLFKCDHVHTNCRVSNCPVLNQHIPFDINFSTNPDCSIIGKGTDTNHVRYEGSLSGTTFNYKFFKGNQYLGYGTYQFNTDFTYFSGNFVDEANGHSGTISGNKQR
jgi:hypothetical protein